MPRNPNDHLQERLVVSYDQAQLTAGLGATFFSPSRAARLVAAKYICPAGLAADNTNWFTVDVRRCGAADALTFTAKIFTAANASEIFTATAHGLLTGDGPVRLTNSGGALPAGVSLATDYYIIKIDANTFYLATTRANAFAGTNLAITGDGTGTHTLSATASTRRPVIMASGVNTDGDGGGAALAPNAFVTLTLSATDANRVAAADDEVLFVATEGGSATLPAGRLVGEFIYI